MKNATISQLLLGEPPPHCLSVNMRHEECWPMNSCVPFSLFTLFAHQHEKNNLWIFYLCVTSRDRELSTPWPLTPDYFSLSEDDVQCAPGGGHRGHVWRLRPRGRGPGPGYCRPRVWLGIPGDDTHDTDIKTPNPRLVSWHHNDFSQAAVKSSYGRRPPTGAGGGLKVPGTAAGPGGLMSSRGRMPTAGQNITHCTGQPRLSVPVNLQAFISKQ